MLEEPNPADWERAASVISLDLTARLLPGIGIATSDPSSLRRATREAIIAAGDGDSAWKERWLGAIERSLGLQEREAITRWVRYGFATAPSTHQEWIAWNTVFTLVERTEDGFRKLALPEEAIEPLLVDYRRSRGTEELQALEDVIRGADLTLWDVEACAAFGFLPDEDDDDVLWGWIRTTWDNHHFQVFFGRIVARLDAPTLAKLWEHGRRLRRANDLSVERLVSPERLQPAVPWPEVAR